MHKLRIAGVVGVLPSVAAGKRYSRHTGGPIQSTPASMFTHSTVLYIPVGLLVLPMNGVCITYMYTYVRTIAYGLPLT
ncbi:hypothetical protein HOLleu_43237 [Holothuria leucospilota]|uniref:Uncharacterized protein n=1 Tax=Holothuria leucospilota TaxID=206669 RepID=A0A9Q0YH84_HOLLE|nr:hypothetical protein HOLleu_43237 [Holothuria leucospilota]